MTVEELIRELEQYPGYWNVEISTSSTCQHRVIEEVTDRQNVSPGRRQVLTTPVVVIR